MDELLQPFPDSFASPDGSKSASIFVAASGEIASRQSEHMHRHDFYELVWLWRGNCTFFSDFEHYPLEQGSLIFISPGQMHDYIVEDGAIRLLIYGFRPSVLPTVAAELVNLLPFDDTKRAPILAVPSKAEAQIETLFEAAHRRFDSRQPGWEAIITAYLRTILTEAAYLMPADIINQSASAAVQLTRAFQQAVEQHYRQQQQVQEYAALLGVTTNHLVKTVRKTIHMTPKQMLQARLLLEAKRLLVHTPYQVNQISDLLQFQNSTTFARWFKKQTQQTPSQFRQTA